MAGTGGKCRLIFEHLVGVIELTDDGAGVMDPGVQYIVAAIEVQFAVAVVQAEAAVIAGVFTCSGAGGKSAVGAHIPAFSGNDIDDDATVGFVFRGRMGEHFDPDDGDGGHG